MFNLLLIADKGITTSELRSELIRNGYSCQIAPIESAKERISGRADLVLVATSDYARMCEVSQAVKQEGYVPIIALVSKEILQSIDGQPVIDDFLVKPYDITELTFRINRLLKVTPQRDDSELIKCGDLTIDLARYEVYISNRPIMLTFREYELLKFLASNRGRVFSREALLARVWDYDYFGGDRTVDVHIRRLRSKLKDSDYTFIETVRNIGYRFVKES